jgi:putative membrane protein
MYLEDEDDMAPLPSTNELAEDRTGLAFERSKMASDRTTMAFMRTAISLIGFGFSIPALFQVITGVPGMEGAPVERARFIGLFMLFLAVFMLTTAIAQQAIYLRRLSRAARRAFPFSIAMFSSCVMLLVALTAMINIFSKVELF